MKKARARVFRKLFYVLLASAITTTSFSQEKDIITISSSNSKRLSERLKDLTIYKVEQKEVLQYKHKAELSQLRQAYLKNSMADKLPSISKKYQEESNYAISKKSAVESIKNKIKQYFSSTEKPKNKQQYLIDGQKIADDNQIGITINQVEKINNNYSREVHVSARLVGNGIVSDEVIHKYYSELEKIEIEIEVPRKPNELRVQQAIDSLSKLTSTSLVYVVDPNLIIDINDFIGEFKILDEKYFMCADSEFNYIKFELVDNLLNHKDVCSNTHGRKYPLLQNTKTNELYYVIGEQFVGTAKDMQHTDELIKIVNDLGFKEQYDGDGYVFINSKTARIPLGYWLENGLKNNKNFISDFDNEQLKISALTKQTIPYSKTLDKYLGQYRIQRSRMPDADINTWRTATSNALKLFDQIHKIYEKYTGVYDYTLFDKSKTYEDFLDNISASRSILGI